MIDPSEFKEKDILQLIKDQIPETLTWEYKSSNSLLNVYIKGKDQFKNKVELTKDISSFANSAGGTIIYGVSEDGHFPVKIDDGLDPSLVSKEWLESIINSNIQRRIEGIVINQIWLEKTSPKKVLYVVSIPSSNTAHMALDKRYYKRFNFQSVMMEDYEIRDIMNRNKSPNLFLTLEDFPIISKQDTFDLLSLRFVVGNDSLVPVEHAYFKLFIDDRLVVHVAGEMDIKPGKRTMFINPRTFQMQMLTQGWSSPVKKPILGGVNYTLNGKTDIKVLSPVIDDSYAIFWEINCPYMEPKRGVFEIIKNGQELKFNAYNKIVHEVTS